MSKSIMDARMEVVLIIFQEWNAQRNAELEIRIG